TSITLARVDDLHQRRPTKCRHAEKPTAKRRSHLAFQRSRITFPEYKCARDRPFARLGRLLKNKGIRRIESYRAKEFHVRGPLDAGSNHAGCSSRDKNLCRKISVLPMRRTNKSPFSLMSRRTPCSRGSRSK